MTKKLALGLTAGIAAFGAVTASASSLGGVDTTDLGTSANVVASCDTDGVGVDYTTAYSGGSYRVTAVKLSGIAATCAGQNVTVTLFDGSDVSLAEKAGSNAGPAQTLALTSPVSAEAVKGVAVVIAG